MKKYELSALSQKLVEVVAANDYDTAELLLSQEADPNQKDARGLTCLHLAVVNQNSKMIALLLRHKADPTVAMDVTVNEYKNVCPPFHAVLCAIQESKHDDKKTKEWGCVEVFAKNYKDNDENSACFNWVLLFAIRAKQYAVVIKLIESKAIFDGCCDDAADKRAPIHYAVADLNEALKTDKQDTVSLIVKVIKSMVIYNPSGWFLNYQNNAGQTAFHLMVTYLNEAAKNEANFGPVRLLSGLLSMMRMCPAVDLKLKDNNKHTALDLAGGLATDILVKPRLYIEFINKMYVVDKILDKVSVKEVAIFPVGVKENVFSFLEKNAPKKSELQLNEYFLKILVYCRAYKGGGIFHWRGALPFIDCLEKKINRLLYCCPTNQDVKSLRVNFRSYVGKNPNRRSAVLLRDSGLLGELEKDKAPYLQAILRYCKDYRGGGIFHWRRALPFINDLENRINNYLYSYSETKNVKKSLNNLCEKLREELGNYERKNHNRRSAALLIKHGLIKIEDKEISKNKEIKEEKQLFPQQSALRI